MVKCGVSAYEVEHLVRVFYSAAVTPKARCTKGDIAYVNASAGKIVVALRIGTDLKIKTVDLPLDEKQANHAATSAMFVLLSATSGIVPPWGMLTGVRPVNRLRKFTRLEGENKAKEIFLRRFFVLPEKYSLAKQIVQNQQPVLSLSTKKSYSLYISIPFCPSRCSYCSFVSRNIGRDWSMATQYVEALKKELAYVSQTAQSLGLQLATIYIGGGTPTSLPAPLLRTLLESVEEYFDTSNVLEYTVEAGRPDCTDYEKLQIIKKFGASRISINPQSMNDDVLHKIGRNHTAQDIVRCVKEARKTGHKNVNMDLIAGLPGDTEASFNTTIAETIALSPENITLHTLTLKRASSIVIDSLPAGIVQQQMLGLAYTKFSEAGYSPYYLYRQKNTLANLENTGWAKAGLEGMYNIFIMEEVHSILAVGAGATTKLVSAGERIERIFNYKYPTEYIAGIDEILRRKSIVRDFYGNNMDT